MKKISVLCIGLFFYTVFLAACTCFSSPEASFSNVVYDSSNLDVTFYLSIVDLNSVGSDFNVNLKCITDDDIDDQSTSIDSIDKAQYSFVSLIESETYTLYVTCDYGNEDDAQIKNSYSFSTTDTETTTSDSLKVTDDDISIEYNVFSTTDIDEMNYIEYLNYLNQSVLENESKLNGYSSYLIN